MAMRMRGWRCGENEGLVSVRMRGWRCGENEGLAWR